MQPCAVCRSTASTRAWLRVSPDQWATRLGRAGGRSTWVVCRDCGLVYQSPRPSELTASLYEGGGYHAAAGGVPGDYVRYSMRRSRDALRWGLTAGRLDVPGRALDIGCGVGGALVALRERGWSVCGVEPDPSLSAHARREFALDARTGMFDAATVPEVGQFDFVFASHVWEHLDDPVAITRDAGRVLAPGGVLMLVVPTFRHSRANAWHAFKSPHNFVFTDVSLGNVLGRAGFEPVDHTFRSGADAELWMVARRGGSEPGLKREAPATVQREIATVPLRLPLGLPGRARAHTSVLLTDPRDFARRARRRLRTLSRRRP